MAATRNSSALQYAGALAFIAGVIILMGIITAEATYPGYSTSQNEISDLGATRPPNSIIVQPAASIFNTTMVVSGLMILAAAYFVHRGYRDLLVTVLIGLLGIGAIGVGIFPGNTGVPHALSAQITFIAGGLSAIAAYRVERAPFRYISVVLGLIALVTLFLAYILGEGHPLIFLGLGGVERWVAYPIVLWITGFGGYLMGDAAGIGTLSRA